MDEQFIREAVENFTRPWPQRRGIESIDRNAAVVLVKVPLNQLSDALAEKAIESQRNVMGSEIEVSGAFVFAYQLVGHPWSIMISGDLSYPSILESSEFALLSKQLEQTVIMLLVSDSAGEISYDLFEGGELVEYFRGSDGELTDDSNKYGIQSQRYLLFPYPDELEEDEDSEAQQTAYFWSRRRQVTAEEIGNIWDFARQLMLDYDAFDPAIDSSYLLREYSLRAGRYQVQNPGFTLVFGYEKDGRSQEVTSVPDLVRVDYFRFGK
ncbi:hypothetical protein HUN01_23270 [Nostoc edaphicum CCNP1411]|uniref:Uncharacterized protein n=1 Tax=Nostoc edaphicum CCNP1411 TaxID=1472755 RepID=A0A7D7QPR8_9NOSO|nr:hypothetical protein [Nostoc edaphicum]QMS90360.1 hypothetical protein HUN01_23270 [Nostoc edaphicum CCNP1411]